MTDSSCDLPASMAEDLELTVAPLSVLIDGKSYVNYLDEREITFTKCYSLFREGKIATTSAANVELFTGYMEPLLKAGKDILYLGFSSGLSSTCQAGAMAAKELMEKYPQRKIYTVDTLCASMGQGLLVYLCAQEKAKGKSIEEVRDYAEATKLHLCHWFTVDDLNHLKRGGRVSAVSAALGTVLNIKPVLHVDDEGHLIFMEKVRGRRQSIKRLAEMMEKTGIDLKDQVIFISPWRLHGRCELPHLPDPGQGKGDPCELCGPRHRRPLRPRHPGPVLPGNPALRTSQNRVQKAAAHSAAAFSCPDAAILFP